MMASMCTGANHESEHDYLVRLKRRQMQNIETARNNLRLAHEDYAKTCANLDAVIAEEAI